ncbi:hypothetical protein [Flavobacterium sp.]|jgi:hypothetical protein|uniref:hypothetical protein n=1 Tax=Flavobacterium sp. TaxID=239 RepID=UPI0008ABD5D0|nr:hypothetical protein [Flavobacterium sp.]OGS65687.1 MAG: hypothetical protein A2X21_01760 [Flavobacteria bacterium GWA2_35_26]HCF02930.1 hypothetical protein [Flavobacterium sp.]
MISKQSTNLISITNNGIILNSKSKSNQQIPFAEVAKVHLQIRHHQTILKIFLISYFIFTLLCMQYLNLEMSIFSAFIYIINFFVINTLDFKSYRLQIVLKNNNVIEKQIPKKLKYDYISLISEIRRNILPEHSPAL